MRPCAAGRDLTNTLHQGWSEPCPNAGTHPLVVDITAVFLLCEDHIDSIDKIMEGQDGYYKLPI